MIRPIPVKKLTCRIVCSNSVKVGATGLLGEHGFAALIEDGSEKILFDTGQTGKALVNNLEVMGIKDIRSIVLSHGHYDHSGGLMEFFARYLGRYALYVQSSVFSRRFKQNDSELREIGMPFLRRELEIAGAEIHESDEPQLVTDWLSTTGVIERNSDFENFEDDFLVEGEAKLEVDRFTDDQAVVARIAGKGLVIVTGCAHSGIINTINQAKGLLGEKNVHAIIGGFHLAGEPKERISRTIEALEKADPGFIIPAHCTGRDAVCALKRAFGRRVIDGDAGLKLTL
ncbi:MAG: MBL fold metallo-hydrolase [Candidatus Methanomethylicus sp.]|nr:MBL fold metallo-hydrolase [Candidatus Methanomethylicus sp.]